MSRLYIIKGARPAGAAAAPAPAPAVAAPVAPAERSFASPFAAPVLSPAAAAPVPIKRPTAATGFAYPTTTTQGLSSDERQRLGYLAQQAWDVAIESDPGILTLYKEQGIKKTAAAKHWRHAQCKLATRTHAAGQIGRISEASRAHYADLESHFAMMAGQSVRAFNAAMDTGLEDDGTTLRADSKQAAFVLKRLKAAMAAKGIHMNYAVKIAKDKFAGKTVLSAKQMWNMVYTLTNRQSAKEGRGNTANRNKSQRSKPPGDQPF